MATKYFNSVECRFNDGRPVAESLRLGMCLTHYNRYHRGRMCSVADCGEPVVKNTVFCSVHREPIIKDGDDFWATVKACQEERLGSYVKSGTMGRLVGP